MEQKYASRHVRGHDVVNQKPSYPNPIYAGYKIRPGSFLVSVQIFFSSKAQNGIYFRIPPVLHILELL
jgi:hypothetical protein